MLVDDEMQIGRIREQADRRLSNWRRCERREQRRQRTPKWRDFPIVDRPAHGVGVGDDFTLVHHRGLDPARQTWEAVTPRSTTGVLVLVEVDRKGSLVEASVGGV